MIDPQLADLFADGSAPERDARFTERVETTIGRARFVGRLAFVLRSTLVLGLIAAIYVAGRALAPAVARIAEWSPEFMGVPIPLVLGALVIGLLLRVDPYLRLRLS